MVHKDSKHTFCHWNDYNYNEIHILYYISKVFPGTNRGKFSPACVDNFTVKNLLVFRKSERSGSSALPISNQFMLSVGKPVVTEIKSVPIK